ncbi:hypothetical protein [Protofrankia sp. BMG5.30]|uniref:hypothetical protein n=1 Tax=Protofrankia sp. BMG5.30 TaxID=1834514 RepID=UPI0009772293|nr:hypothetical protein [Protofrankia sp. BMG5.30]ONH34233.1 hypothetical protein BL254_17065 [Protofrankia sp. BMG5.30]
MNFRVIAVTLLLGGGLALSATLGSPATAQQLQEQLPDCAGPVSFASVDPERVLAGGSVLFSSCGFAPGSTVTIDDNGARTRTVTADNAGNFAIRLTLPTQGDHYLTATGTPKDAVDAASYAGPADGGIGAQPTDTEERKAVGMVWVDASGAAASADDADTAGEAGGDADGALPVSGTQAGVLAAAAAALIGGGVFFRSLRRRARDGDTPSPTAQAVAGGPPPTDPRSPGPRPDDRHRPPGTA